MTKEIQAFGTFLRKNIDTHLDKVVTAMAECGSTYATDDDIHEKVRVTYMALAESMEQDDLNNLIEFGKKIGMARIKHGFGIQEVLASVEVFRNHIWEQLDMFMQDRTPWSPALVRHMESFINTLQIQITMAFGDALDEIRSELRLQADQLESQQRTIRELGTPILPVHEGVLVLPLVGGVDSSRATQVMETLLEAIARYQADLVIVDITGVPLVDTSVANYILQAARAAKLVGTSVILVGIGSEIAQTIVHLGVDMSDIMTLANLQEGIQYAFEQLGITIEATVEPTPITVTTTTMPRNLLH